VGANLPVDNASLILLTLDSRLRDPTRLILYGRAALQLGFDIPPVDAARSKDVDAIIPLSDLQAFSADASFWDAQEATNAELGPKGLYITHLFRADQVFLRRDWEQHLVLVMRPKTRWLHLFRPKMMRGDDEQDMADVAFLIRHDRITSAQIEQAFSEAVIPDLVELREAFDRAKPRVRQLAQETVAVSTGGAGA
jgi:hypothetical protein